MKFKYFIKRLGADLVDYKDCIRNLNKENRRIFLDSYFRSVTGLLYQSITIILSLLVISVTIISNIDKIVQYLGPYGFVTIYFAIFLVAMFFYLFTPYKTRRDLDFLMKSLMDLQKSKKNKK